MSAALPFNNPRRSLRCHAWCDDDAEPNGIRARCRQAQQFPGQPPMQPGMQPGQTTPTLTRPGMLPAPPPNVPGNPYQTNPQQPIIRPPGVPGPGGPGGGAS
jgi:hypothetical protein